MTFRQLTGTAMGICISVFFANTYMYELTRHLVHSPPPQILFAHLLKTEDIPK